MIPRQLARREANGAIHAQKGVAPEQGLVVQRRYVVMPGIAGIARVADRGDDGIDLEHRAPPGLGVHAAEELVEHRSARVGHLLLVVQPRCLLIVDPFQRHSRDVRTQDELGEPAHRLGGDDAQVLVMAVVSAFQINP